MIHQQYELASLLHGHKCPGLAIGVRAAEEAKRILKIENIQDKNLYCVVESLTCCIDGIQVLAGCTMGKGNLIYRPAGKSVFNFFFNGEGLRLSLRPIDFRGDRDAMKEHILTAPFEEIFDIGKPGFAAPTYTPHGERVCCSVCGEQTEESYMRVKDGKPVCLDCV